MQTVFVFFVRVKNGLSEGMRTKYWFDLIHYVPSTSFQLCRDGSSLVEPVLKPRSHCADGATVHRDAGQPVFRDAPGHIS